METTCCLLVKISFVGKGVGIWKTELSNIYSKRIALPVGPPYILFRVLPLDVGHTLTYSTSSWRQNIHTQYIYIICISMEGGWGPDERRGKKKRKQDLGLLLSSSLKPTSMLYSNSFRRSKLPFISLWNKTLRWNFSTTTTAPGFSLSTVWWCVFLWFGFGYVCFFFFFFLSYNS